MITVVDQFGQVLGYIDEAAPLEGGGDGTGGGSLLEFLTVLGLIVLVLI